MINSKPGRTRNAGARTPNGLDQVWEDRKTLAKKEMAAESAANDAKTARLRALRLEKEKQDAEARALAGPEPARAPAKKRIRRIVAN